MIGSWVMYGTPSMAFGRSLAVEVDPGRLVEVVPEDRADVVALGDGRAAGPARCRCSRAPSTGSLTRVDAGARSRRSSARRPSCRRRSEAASGWLPRGRAAASPSRNRLTTADALASWSNAGDPAGPADATRRGWVRQMQAQTRSASRPRARAGVGSSRQAPLPAHKQRALPRRCRRRQALPRGGSLDAKDWGSCRCRRRGWRQASSGPCGHHGLGSECRHVPVGPVSGGRRSLRVSAQ